MEILKTPWVESNALEPTTTTTRSFLVQDGYPICVLVSANNFGIVAGEGERAKNTIRNVQSHVSKRSVYVNIWPNQRTCMCRG